MPTLSVNRQKLFDEIGRCYSDEEFDELCFEFGIELDDVTSERQMMQKETSETNENLSDEVLYKIEIPANRFDLLCMEGLSRALRLFQGKELPPLFTISYDLNHTLAVSEAVAGVRPFVCSFILRNVAMTPDFYASFIDFQDKLHSSLGRKRTLVSMGTHDLDKIEAPFLYTALPPEEISFVPLNQTKEMNGVELMQHYESDMKIKKYLHIIKDEPLYSVILDAKKRILSLPPLINSDFSKISLNTKNIFVEITGTDLTKVRTAMNLMAANYSMYCQSKYEIEQVQVIYPQNSSHALTYDAIDMAEREESITVPYISSNVGVSLNLTQIVGALGRMGYKIASKPDGENIKVLIPAYRSDILHKCDIMEDVAIAHGFNNIPRSLPTSQTTGAETPINKLSDLIRREIAMCGYSEVLTFSLCSHNEAYAYLKRPDSGKEAVLLSNPKTVEFEVVRPLLLPGLLKTIACNKKMPLPIKIFEVSDVVYQDESMDVLCKNQRRIAAVFSGNTTGFELIRGLAERIIQMLGATNAVTIVENISSESDPNASFYFPGRAAKILLNGSEEIGHFGVIHPEVIHNFDCSPMVLSSLEINVEVFI